jgi:hypothetical protein
MAICSNDWPKLKDAPLVSGGNTTQDKWFSPGCCSDSRLKAGGPINRPPSSSSACPRHCSPYRQLRLLVSMAPQAYAVIANFFHHHL